MTRALSDDTVLELLGVDQRFPGPTGPVPVLEKVDLKVPRGQFLCVVGASGSGKSTLLSLVAGLRQPTSGQVLLDGQPVAGPGPERGLVLQSGAVYPWRTVAGNVGFGLELLPLGKAERQRRVDWYLAETGLTALRDKLPKHLSGGQRGRVAIARALACEPEILLLDEPFGALDVQTKEDMQLFIHRIWQDTGITVLMVTHDVEEAVFLGQRIIVLACDPGRIAADIEVPLPAGRDLTVRRTPEFLALRAQVEDMVRTYHRGHVASGVA